MFPSQSKDEAGTPRDEISLKVVLGLSSECLTIIP